MMHIRGDQSSYDAWETAGATGWNYDAPCCRSSNAPNGSTKANSAFRE